MATQSRILHIAIAKFEDWEERHEFKELIDEDKG